MIASRQKEKTLSKVIFVDTLFNVSLFAFVFRILYDIASKPGFSGEGIEFDILLYILISIGIFAGCEFLYFILKKWERIPYMTENMAKVSIALNFS